MIYIIFNMTRSLKDVSDLDALGWLSNYFERPHCWMV